MMMVMALMKSGSGNQGCNYRFKVDGNVDGMVRYGVVWCGWAEKRRRGRRQREREAKRGRRKWREIRPKIGETETKTRQEKHIDSQKKQSTIIWHIRKIEGRQLKKSSRKACPNNLNKHVVTYKSNYIMEKCKRVSTLHIAPYTLWKTAARAPYGENGLWNNLSVLFW